MKILIVHNHYQQPGGEQVAVEAQRALLRGHGHDVLTYTRHNAEILDFGLRERALFFPRTLYSRRTYHELTELVRRERPDIAHVHNVFPLLSPAVYRALDDAGVPTVQTIHNFRFLCPNGLFFTQGRACERCSHGFTLHAVPRRCYRDSYVLSALYATTIAFHRRVGTFGLIDHFIALSPFSAAKLVDNGLVSRDRISVVGNFLPDPLPAPGPAHRPPRVLFLGRLSPEKGVATLIEAAAHLPELTVGVLGDGPDAASLAALARSQGLVNVEFLGKVTGEAKWAAMRQARAVVIPSVWYEHFPFVLLESMATGTPAIASRLGSLAELIEDGQTGMLFRAGDSEDLAKKLHLLLTDGQGATAMGEHARQALETHWCAKAHLAGLLRSYELAAATRAAKLRSR